MAFTDQWGQGQWQGTGGGTQAQRYYATKDFWDIFGRAPREDELSMLQAAYDSGDKNIAGTSAGRSAVAQYFQAQENTPDKQYAKQQAGYQAEAPKHYDAINQMFQGTLGRDATQQEKDHFGSLLASGQVDPYTIGQFLQQLPENVKKQDAEFRNQLSGELQKQDAQYYNEQIMPGIQSAFANQGRDVRSSGFSNSLALAAQAQNRQREGFLSNLSAQQYGGQQANARQDYLNAYGQYTGFQDYSRQRSAQLQDAATGRVNELQNYAMQRQAYDDYLRRYGKRSSGLGQGIGSLAGMGLGALLAAPTGGMSIAAGAMLGGMGGGTAGSLFDR